VISLKQVLTATGKAASAEQDSAENPPEPANDN